MVAGALAEGAGFPASSVVTGATALVALVFWIRAPETLVRQTVEEADPRMTTSGCRQWPAEG